MNFLFKAQLRIYAAGLAILFLLLGLTLWLPGIALWSTGELWPPHFIVKQQRSHDGLWSSGLVQAEEAYKQALYEQVPASVVAIGTSRVLQVRQSMFGEPFVNMGRGFELLQVDEALPQLFKTRKPALVLWGFDYWHFASKRAQVWLDNKEGQRKTMGIQSSGKTTVDILPRQILSTWDLMRKEQQVTDWIKASAGIQLHPGYRIGLRAVLTNNGGYAADGSHYNFPVHRHPKASFEEWQRAFQRSKDMYQLQPNDVVSPELVRRFRETLSYLARENIPLLIFVVPLPGQYFERTRNPEFAPYFDAARQALVQITAETGTGYFDYLDGASLSLPDREFIDATHPGETAMARLLLNMAEKNRRLHGALNISLLQRMISENAGSATVRQEFYRRFGVTPSE